MSKRQSTKKPVKQGGTKSGKTASKSKGIPIQLARKYYRGRNG